MNKKIKMFINQKDILSGQFPLKDLLDITRVLENWSIKIPGFGIIEDGGVVYLTDDDERLERFIRDRFPAVGISDTQKDELKKSFYYRRWLVAEWLKDVVVDIKELWRKNG